MYTLFISHQLCISPLQTCTFYINALSILIQVLSFSCTTTISRLLGYRTRFFLFLILVDSLGSLLTQRLCCMLAVTSTKVSRSHTDFIVTASLVFALFRFRLFSYDVALSFNNLTCIYRYQWCCLFCTSYS